MRERGVKEKEQEERQRSEVDRGVREKEDQERQKYNREIERSR